MGSTQLYSLTWGEFGTSLVSAVQHLRCHGDLVDVTLAAGGKSYPAHKIVLSAASPFLLDLLKNTPCHHPIVMLSGVNAPDLEALLEFVYRGEVSVDPSQLPSLLQTAQCLDIQGLAPGALHPDAKLEAAGLLETAHPSISREVVAPFTPTKKKKKGKRKNTDGHGSHGGKRRFHHGRADGLGMLPPDILTNSMGALSSENDLHLQNGHVTDILGNSDSKIKGASDQPAICPLCGATLRQARNLRRHLEMLHFGAGKVPPSELDPSVEDNPNGTHPNHHRSVSRSSSHQSVATSPGGIATPGSDQSVATLVVMPSTLCQPVMLASPNDTQNQHDTQHSRSTPNLACVSSLLPPPSSMLGHHSQHFLRYPGHPSELVNRADQQILRGVGIYTDTRLPRPDPGGGIGCTEM